MIEKLTSLYLAHLALGFIILREAMASGSKEWLTAEIELLHNIPTLIRDENKLRHLYFWKEERGLYLDRIRSLPETDAQSKMRTYYEPIWKDMEPTIKELEEETKD
jgi:hypothetical protein